jgi:hypothetical protein
MWNPVYCCTSCLAHQSWREFLFPTNSINLRVLDAEDNGCAYPWTMPSHLDLIISWPRRDRKHKDQVWTSVSGDDQETPDKSFNLSSYRGLLPSILWIWSSKMVILLGVVIHICSPSTWKAEAGGSQVQSQPGTHRTFKANLDYILRPCHFIHHNSYVLHIFPAGASKVL